MPSRRQIAGAQARARGAAWEQYVADWLTYQARDGILTWLRTQEPTVRTRHGIRATGQGPADYLVLGRGYCCALEAKSTTLSRWLLRSIAPHQGAALDTWLTHGGCSAVVVWHTGAARDIRQVIPWPAIRVRWYRMLTGEARRGEASLGADEIGRIGYPLDLIGVWLDQVANWQL